MSCMKSATHHNSHIASLKDQKYFNDQTEAGKILTDVMTQMIDKINNQSFASYLDLSRFAESVILKHNAVPTFKNYKNFPEAVCISINNELVHGIPKNIAPKPTDLVTLDFGVTVNQSIVDSAITCSAEPSTDDQELIYITQQSLYAGINAIALNERVGTIGEAINEFVMTNGYYVIKEMGGHGIGYNSPHEYPFIANKDVRTNGIRIQPGMTFAIEPLVHKNPGTFLLDKDKWTVNMSTRCAHFEHTIQIYEDHLLIVTHYENFDGSKINKKIYF